MSEVSSHADTTAGTHLSQHPEQKATGNGTGETGVEVPAVAPGAAEENRRRLPLLRLAILVVLVGVANWQRDEIGGGWNRFSGERTGVGILVAAQRQPAFDLQRTTIPRNEIRSGGPPKDGIPAITNPKMIPVEAARYLKSDDRVIGVLLGEKARAYPLRILNYHEVVNDVIAKTPVAVTYCPLCDSAVVFDRRTPLGVREFGVSGLLYNSNVLMYDRRGRPEGLWSQMKTEGVSGPGVGKPLKMLPLELTTWQDWKTRYPQTQVMSPRTGYPRDYGRSPYSRYFATDRLMFPATPEDDRLDKKAPVLGVWTEKAARAYPVSAFSEDRRQVTDTFDGHEIVIEYNPAARSLRVVKAHEDVNWAYSFWFAWYAFRPHTDVFE